MGASVKDRIVFKVFSATCLFSVSTIRTPSAPKSTMTLMVDTENKQVAEKTLKAIRSFTDAPIKVLVNTHVHPDHTGANAFFAQQGALIFAQDNLRTELLRPPLRANG